MILLMFENSVGTNVLILLHRDAEVAIQKCTEK